MPWLAQSASAKTVNNLAIPGVQNVNFLQRFPDVLEDTFTADLASIFFFQLI